MSGFDDSSDYGSDFTPDEEELLNELLAKVSSGHAPIQNAAALEDLQSLQPAIRDIEDYAADPPSPRPKVVGREKFGSPWKRKTQQHFSSQAAGPSNSFSRDLGAARVEHPSSVEGRNRERERDIAREQQWIQAAKPSTGDSNQPAIQDMRSPVERFRRPPNKAFSVTDLISPAWCELQYWYTLTKHGRKIRTAAMKQGTVVHKSLEDELYTTVPVEITTKEDAWALRIWNVIQGLRTLREFGITRELEVWGVVDGEIVNGVIDQLSYECPDPKLEMTAAAFYADAEAARAALPEYQMSLTDYLLSPSQGGKTLSEIWSNEADAPTKDVPAEELPPELYNISRVYITDIKTTGRGSAPTVKSSSFRPTLLQLQLYYHMLNRLITSDDVTIELLASRYDFDPQRTFTDAFIAEVGGLNDQFFDALSSHEFDPDYIPTPDEVVTHRSSSSSGSSSPATTSQDSTSVLLAHSNLASLWTLMKDQLRQTFLPFSPPAQSSSSVSPSIPAVSQPHILESYSTVISPLLTARYISAVPTAELESRVLASRSFLFDPTHLRSYLTDQMGWWRGGRDPRGVEILEAWKCRICDFRDECTWRQEREWAMASRGRRKKNPEVG